MKHLIGRRPELAAIERALDACAGSDPGLLELSGEPGIGKTRLLAELEAIAGCRGYLVTSGQASEYERTDAFAAFPIEELTRDGSVVDGGAPLDVFRAVRLRLERLAPMVIMLDDLHWADAASLALLRYLLRRPPRAAVLLAVAYRPAQAPAALLAALGDASLAPRRLELGPLSAAEADDLLRGADLIGPQRRACARAGGGNPFYLLALAELERAGVRPAVDGPTMPTLPLRLRQVVLAEFAGLSEAGALSASAAAVAGAVFDPELVRRVAGTPVDGFTELVARDLVRPGAGGTFSYRHPLLRHAAYHLATPDWRLGAHRRAAVVAAERGQPPVARAPHVERYAAAGDGEAAGVLIAAARVEAARAPAIAAHWLGAALRLGPDGPGAAALVLELARAQGIAGDLAGSRATLHEALSTLEPGTPARLAAVTFCAMVERLLGHHRQARALLRAELDHCGGEARPELALELAVGALMRGDLIDNRRWAHRAARWAAEAERGVRATAWALLSLCAYADDDVPAALDHLSAAAELVDAMPDGELAGQLGAALWLGWNEVYLERYRDARGHLERGISIARATGQVHLLPLLLSCLALALRWLGRLPDASRYAEEAVDAADLTGSADLSALALAVQSWIATWIGESDLASAAGRSAVVAAGGRGGYFAALASAMLARGSGGTAEAIVEAFGGPDLPLVDPRSRISWWVVVVRAEIAQGRLDRAEQYAVRAEALARRIGLAGHRGNALLARAQVLLARRDPAGLRYVLAAAEAFAAAGCPLDEGYAYFTAATFVAGPSTYATRARTLFEACGALALARRAGVLETPGALSGLTQREAQTAELVAEGITNREIARRLGISEKTVEKYVSSLLTKLGVAGRAAIAALVGRSRADPGPVAQRSQVTRRSSPTTTSSPASS